MSSMRDLLNTPMFEPVLGYIDLQREQIMGAPMLHLTAPATLQGVLALGQLEAACLDLGIKYSRRFFMPQNQRPHGEAHVHVPADQGLTVVLDVEEETWDHTDLKPSELIRIVPLRTHLSMGSSNRQHIGALDVVLQAAAIGARLTPNGRRVRKLRPYLSLGLWLRGALDTTFDPIHSATLEHLKEEGSVRVVPIPEVPNPSCEMIPEFSNRQLIRLQKAWPRMDVEQRRFALSELVLPALVNPALSTPRLEELIWHRMLVGDQEQDVVSQAHGALKSWPDEAQSLRLHASKMLDRWLSEGLLSV